MNIAMRAEVIYTAYVVLANMREITLACVLAGTVQCDFFFLEFSFFMIGGRNLVFNLRSVIYFTTFMSDTFLM